MFQILSIFKAGFRVTILYFHGFLPHFAIMNYNLHFASLVFFFSYIYRDVIFPTFVGFPTF